MACSVGHSAAFGAVVRTGGTLVAFVGAWLACSRLDSVVVVVVGLGHSRLDTTVGFSFPLNLWSPFFRLR